MSTTRSSQVSDSAARQRDERKRKRDLLKSQIEQREKSGAQVGDLHQQLADLDRMDTEDDFHSGVGAAGLSNDNPPPIDPSSDPLNSSGIATNPAGTSQPNPLGLTLSSNPPGSSESGTNESGTNESRMERDAAGELCVSLGGLSIIDGTPVAFHQIREKIGLIVRLGTLEHCIYHMDKQSKGYPVGGLPEVVRIETTPPKKVVGIMGVVVYDRFKKDVKVKIEEAGAIRVVWITWTNLLALEKNRRRECYGKVQQVWDAQQRGYQQDHPDHVVEALPERARM